jgi:hypothetical protein
MTVGLAYSLLVALVLPVFLTYWIYSRSKASGPKVVLKAVLLCAVSITLWAKTIEYVDYEWWLRVQAWQFNEAEVDFCLQLELDPREVLDLLEQGGHTHDHLWEARYLLAKAKVLHRQGVIDDEQWKLAYSRLLGGDLTDLQTEVVIASTDQNKSIDEATVLSELAQGSLDIETVEAMFVFGLIPSSTYQKAIVAAGR